jgi:hypothetical protein
MAKRLLAVRLLEVENEKENKDVIYGFKKISI